MNGEESNLLNQRVLFNTNLLNQRVNLEIEKPTKIIQIKLEETSFMKKSNNSLDFYEINGDDFKLPTKKPFQIDSNVPVLNSSVLSFDEPFLNGLNNHIPFNNSIEFLINSFKNDVRVRNFIFKNNKATLFFCDIEDSISFYKQYFQVLELKFKFENDLEISHQFENSGNIRIFPTKFYSFVPLTDKTGHKDLLNDINTIIFNITGDDDLKVCKNGCLPDFINIVQNTFCINQNANGIEKMVKCNDQNANGFEKSASSNKPGILPAKSFFFSQKSLKANEPKTQDEFDARVMYFNKMKSMFSKNEIKKIAEFIEMENLEYIFGNIKELCVGSSSNLIIQELFKSLSNENICKIIKSLGSDISAISATKYGAYTIQTLLMACYSKESQDLIVQNFGDQARFLLCHEIGNYTIQRILLFNENYVYKLLVENLSCMLSNNLGIKVFKRCLELLKNKIPEILNEIKKQKIEIDLDELKDITKE
jgi:hypothetical protein